MTKITALFVLLVLSISPMPIDSSSNTVTKIATSKTEVSDFGDKETHVIVFAKTQDEFSELLGYSHSKEYPTLLAVKISINEYKKVHLGNRFPSIFPASLYLRAELTPVPVKEIEKSVASDRDILGVTGLWEQGYNGTGIIVGIIDNGVNFKHPDLVSTEYVSKNFTIDGVDVPYDHGTLVAGAIVSSGANSINQDPTGTAIGAKIASANMGQTKEGFLVGDFLEAFDWLANITDLHVINTSWSGGGENIWLPVVQRLEKLGILVVGSAGNDGSGYFKILGSPANTVHGISVAASTYNLDLASFSSQGPTGGGFAKPDVIAPGQGIFTTSHTGGYTSATGTSLSSPLVTGSIASLLSGIIAEGIDWNIGLLKAAVLNTSYNPGNISELRAGQGFVNATNSLEFIRNRNIDAWVPQITYATPTKGFFEFLTKLRQDVSSQIPFTLISSNNSRVTLSIEGNASQILAFNPLNNSLFSQSVFMNVNTYGKSTGIYNGHIVINDTVAILRIPINLVVEEAPKFRVMFDLYHTTTDYGYTNYRAGFQTAALIDVMNDKGVWVDMVDTPFTAQILTQYDLLWMADPFDYNSYQDISLSPSELDSLEYYLSRGGRLFLHYFGLFKDPYPLDGIETVGNNPEYINKILNLVDMSMYTESPSIIDYFISENSNQKESVTNSSILGNGDLLISTVDTNPIVLSGSARSVVNSDTIATFSNLEYGRVLVSTNTQWMKSEDANGDQNSDDYQFMENVVDWFFNGPRIEFLSNEFTETNVTIKFSIIDNEEEITPHVKKVSNEFFEEESYNITQVGADIFAFTANYSEDGDYIFEISAGFDYYRWENRRDTHAPEIVARQHKHLYSPGKDFLLEFNITDNLDVIDKTKINATINQEPHRDIFFTLGVYYVQINGTEFKEGNYELTITVKDNSGNIGELTYKFRIGLDEGLSPLQITLISLGIIGVIAGALVIGKKQYEKRKAMTQTDSS